MLGVHFYEHSTSSLLIHLIPTLIHNHFYFFFLNVLSLTYPYVYYLQLHVLG